jgi:phenylacetate-CoA ligase
VSAYGRKLIKQRHGDTYHSALDHYVSKKYDWLKDERDLQDSETRKLVLHAARNSRFYRNLYSGMDIEGIRQIEDLARLPIVDKELLRENIQDVYTVSPDFGVEAFTGGTTGKSLKVLYTRDDFQKRMAYLDAYRRRCGVSTEKASIATFSGRAVARGIFQGKSKIYWRENRAFNQRLYSTFDLSDETIPYYIENLNKFSPDVLNGFVSAIYQIAGFIMKNGVSLQFRPKAIFTTSETLLPLHRAKIEAAFRCKVFNQYASAEGAPFITECVEGSLHYNIDTGVIECQDFGNGPEMLVTSFTSYGTPLIRYRIGDGVIFKDGTCSCGHCHPLVQTIDGRKVDYLVSAEKGRVSLSHLADVIKGIPNSVREMQFIQDDPAVVVLRLSVDEALFDTAAKRSILDEMEFRFGKGTRITLEFVESIEREPSGKFALIKNRIPGAGA